ncbi:unnamed protein product, partial [Brassica rapa]
MGSSNECFLATFLMVESSAAPRANLIVIVFLASLSRFNPIFDSIPSLPPSIKGISIRRKHHHRV